MNAFLDSVEVESAIESFEAARSVNDATRIADYLPARTIATYDEIATELIRIDMEFAWQNGQRVSFDSYRKEFPDIVADPSRRNELAFEEFRLRWRNNENPDRAEFATRFKVDTDTWPVLTENESTWLEPGFASSKTLDLRGNDIPGFQIIEELGRGAVGRVYLAKQESLADRPVVLKCSERQLHESNRIARLQHTNIVPIHSAHESNGLQIVCMPYFGKTTLSHVIHGKTHNEENDAPRPLAANLANRDEDACLDVVEQLALGLEHAHSRGIWHQDIKPANVLLADHGPAMLLDFNLSKDETEAKSLSRGGTLAYMAPEQIRGLSKRSKIGPWSDVYSLGIVLYQLLTGQLPFTAASKQDHNKALRVRGTPPSAKVVAPNISHAAAAIIDRCLAPNIEDRYQSATELATDIRRHREHLPLLHAKNASTQERIHKWFQRHPRLTSMGSVATIAATLLGLAAMAWTWQHNDLVRIQSEQQIDGLQSAVNRSRAALSIPGTPADLVNNAAADLKNAIAQMGLSVEGQPSSHEANASQWKPLNKLDAETQTAFGASLGEACYLLANATHDDDDSIKQAQRFSRLSESGFSIAAIHSGTTPGDAEDLLQAIHEIQGGDYSAALRSLQLAKQKHPQDASVHLLLGNCHFAQGKVNEAVLDFTAAASLWPDSHVPLLYRGLARMEAGDLVGARSDFQLALEIKPDSPTSRFNLAQTYVRQKQWSFALSELNQLVKSSDPATPKSLLLRSRVHRRMNRHDAADQDRRRSQSLPVTDEDDAIALALAELPQNAEACRDRLARVLDTNPYSSRALQNMAHVYAEHLGNLSQAMEYLGRFLAIRQFDATAIAGKGVLFARLGNHEQALADANQVLELASDNDLQSVNAYQIACIHALNTSHDPRQKDKALSYLAMAIRKDSKWLAAAKSDPDLANIRDTKEFNSLTKAAQTLGHE